MRRNPVRALVVAAIACAPCIGLAASSENYALGVQEASAAGASSSERFRAESIVGATLANGKAVGGTYAVKTGVRPQARFERPAVSLGAWPVQAIVGQPLTLRAMIASGASLAGAVRFTDNGSTIAHCASVAVQPLAGSGAGVATCRIESAAAGAHRYAAQFSQLAEAGPLEASLDVASTAAIARDYTDLWWGGASQNGWGISIAQHGAMQFNVLYTYDAKGRPVWYAMPGGTWDAAGTTFSGALYEPASAPFDAYVASRMQVGAPVGQASIRFTSASTAQLAYTIDGVSGSKAIERQPIAPEDGGPRLQVNDMWWGGEPQNGWGVNIAQQGRMLFATWFSYDAGGDNTWFFVPGGAWSGASFTGDLYAATSSPWLGASYSPAALVPEKVGSMTLDFADQGFATMTYTVNGRTQSKTIVRQPY